MPRPSEPWIYAWPRSVTAGDPVIERITANLIERLTSGTSARRAD